jgi:predicted membrane protein
MMRMNLGKYDYPKMKMILSICAAAVLLPKLAHAQSFGVIDIMATLAYIQNLLMHIGPILSAILFIIAGLLYAIGQLFPSHQRASFHTTAGDMIMGAVVVAVLSISANSFALASTHLLSNGTVANVT